MNRTEQIEFLKNQQHYDIIIIGGGATGLGCAVDAASRGYKTLLLEKHDFAKGTSSRATKLVHGGVRYLAQGNIRLVREALLERGRLLQNAAHVCHPLSFVVPSYRWWQKWYYGFGLWWYEFLSGKLSLGKTKLLSKKGALKLLPGLSRKKFSGGVQYFDGQFDDARLAINLAQTAVDHGAAVINYCSLKQFTSINGKISGLIAKDELSDDEFILSASVVINATGVFADSVLQLAEKKHKATITPSQGIHLVVDKHFFEGNSGMMIPTTDDGRVLFAIPWHDKLLLGTTDTEVSHITAEPKPLEEEIDFVISHFNRYSSATISRKDVLSAFAGLRPLAKAGAAKKTAVMPRDHHVELLPSGLIHITGGKWTTYRRMAEDAIDKAAASSGLPVLPCKTKDLKVHGCTTVANNDQFSIYGTDADAIKKMMEDDEELAEKLHPDYPYTKAELKWFVEQEMAITIEDVLARRCRLLFLDANAAIDASTQVATCLLNWEIISLEQSAKQLNEFNELASGYLL